MMRLVTIIDQQLFYSLIIEQTHFLTFLRSIKTVKLLNLYKSIVFRLVGQETQTVNPI